MEEKLLEIFRGIFTEVDPSEITLESEFRDFDQFSSLTQMTIIDEITNKLNVKIKLRPFIKAETIEDVLRIITEE